MKKTYRCNHFTKQLLCALLATVALLVGCQKKDLLPQPEFPLSEAALTAALEEAGLAWSIEQVDELTKGTDKGVTYSLHRPESGRDYNSVFINSYDSKEFGRRLQIYFREPQNREWRQEEKKAAVWEDWREMLMLVARLYGGFEDTKEIYRACSAVELPQDTNTLWQGTLTGGYFRMRTESPMKPQRFSLGNSVSFNVYESEAYYLKLQRMAEEAREERMSQQQNTALTFYG